MSLRLKVGPRQAVRAKVLPRYPVDIVGGTGIAVATVGGSKVIAVDGAPASEIVFNPTTEVSATNVQDAIAELGAENLPVFTPRGVGTSDIQSALDACEDAGGGIVYLRPLGEPYIVSNLSVGNGVCLLGSPGRAFPGETASVAEWAASGTWIKSTDTTNPTINLTGHGSGVVGIGFIRDQVAPGVGAYTPTTFPYEIKVTATFFTVDDILTVGTTHDIWLAYTTGSGGGTYSRLTNIFSGALIRGIKIDNVNDTMHLANIRHRGLFYESTASLVTYRLANTIAWDCGYFDNPQVDGLEFFHVHTAFLFTDQTCLGNTHSLFNGQFSTVGFNLVRYAMRVAAGTTTVRARFGSVLAQSDTASSISDQLFLLTSDNANIGIGTLSIPATGGEAIEIGNGSGGRFSVDDLEVLDYGVVDNTATCIIANAGSRVRLGTWSIATAASTGESFSGSGGYHGTAEQTLAAGTLSSAATLNIVLTPYTGYRAFRIDLESLLPATDGVIPYLRFSTDGGANYDAGASNYSYAANVTEQGGSNAPYGSGAATEIQLSHPSAAVGNASNEGGRWSILLSDPSSSALWSKAQFEGCYIDNGGTPRTIDVRGTGHRRTAQNTDAIRVLFSSGNIASGKWRLIGLL